MACAFTHDIFEMIAMIAEVRTPCWWSDQDAARKSLRRRQPDTGMVTEVFAVEQAGWSGELYYAPPTLRTDWRTFARPVGESNPRIVAGLGRWVR